MVGSPLPVLVTVRFNPLLGRDWIAEILHNLCRNTFSQYLRREPDALEQSGCEFAPVVHVGEAIKMAGCQHWIGRFQIEDVAHDRDESDRFPPVARGGWAKVLVPPLPNSSFGVKPN